MLKEPVVSASYTLPESMKERIERMAAQQDLNASQVARRIFSEFFDRLDAESAKLHSAPLKA